MKTSIIIILLISFATFVNGQQNIRMYVYNNGQDTLFFSKIGPIHFEHTGIQVENDQRIDTILIDKSKLTSLLPLTYDSLLILDSIQIDGKGSKEIIFCRKIGYLEYVHSGTYDGINNYNIEKVEIWNIDTKEMYWSGIIFYNAILTGIYNSFSEITFKYDFKIDSLGNIEIIKELAQIINRIELLGLGEKSIFEIKPELKIGCYQFRNGEYILKE